jgi:hypothetical protein
MRGVHNILCVPVHSGIPGNKVQNNRMAIKCAVVASRRSYGVGNGLYIPFYIVLLAGARSENPDLGHPSLMY